jgi:hypothetical protein
MHPYEWWGRILLAIAVGALFLVVVASMITGAIFWPGAVVVALIGIVGGAGMALGQGRDR